MFIVLDGIDGSGKATQAELLKKHFELEWKKVKLLDYPRYGNPSAHFVERYLNGEYGKNVLPKQASLFYALDRFDQKDELERDIDFYDYVISNRYVSASMIHQTGKLHSKEEMDEFLEWLDDLEYNILCLPRPDKIIFLNTHHDISNQNIEKKKKREYIKSENNRDLHEGDSDHMMNSYLTGLYVAEKFGWDMVECEQWWKMLPKNEITQMIIKKIKW